MRKTQLNRFNNEWYRPGCKSKMLFWFIFNSLFINTYLPIPLFVKVAILRVFGAKIRKRLVIKPKVNIKYPWFLEVNNDVWIGEGVWIDNLAKVTIDSNVCISQGAMLLCGNHNYKKTSFDLMVGEIALKEGVWIGAQSIVCPGVTCHSHSVLTVGSVATSDLDAFGIYQGNPALKVKTRYIEK